jgi:hypothetical protein
MKVTAWTFMVATVAAFAATIAIGRYGGMEGFSPLPLFDQAFLNTRLADLWLAGGTAVTAVVGSLQLLTDKGGGRSFFLTIMTWSAPVAGLAAFVERSLTTWAAVREAGGADFILVAPDLAEALLPLSLGLLLGAVAAVLNAMMQARAKRPRLPAAAG